MPTYEYACKACGEHLEVVQSFKDTALSECPACRGPLRKVFGNIGIAFKGSGFYRTDSRSGTRTGSGSSGEAKAASSSDGGSGEGGGAQAPKTEGSKALGAKATAGTGASGSGTAGAKAATAT